MGSELDKERLMRELRGTTEMIRGNAIYDPFTHDYVRIDRRATSLGDDAAARLAQPAPTSPGDSQLYIDTLQQAGVITPQQATEARQVL